MTLLHKFVYLRECLVLNEFLDHLLEKLVELFTVVLVVTLVHDDFVDLHKFSIFADICVIASQEAKQAINVLIANKVFSLFICEFVSHFCF